MRNEYMIKDMRFILRVTLQLYDDSIGQIEWPAWKERTQRGLTAEAYPNAGNHIAIFEVEIKQPPMMRMETATYTEFLHEGRMNFKNWKLVDIDNYMKGNKHFTELDSEDPVGKFQEKVDRLMKSD